MSELNVVTQVALRLVFAYSSLERSTTSKVWDLLAYGSLERTAIFKILGNNHRRSLKRRESRLSEHKRRKSGLRSLSVRLAHT